MATNVFFDNYSNFNEQQLVEDLVIESIKMYGVDVIYITRVDGAIDKVFNEDDLPLYNETFEFETYVKNVDGFEGEGDFLSKFGLQIRDQMTLTVANRTFEQYVTREQGTVIRPKEGDLIYFPLSENIFEIKFVEDESLFYQSGALQVYDMVCELAEYTGQRMQTGRDNIDNYFSRFNREILTSNTATLNAIAELDPISRNLTFEQEGDAIIDFSEIDPFSESININDN
jgi:hypothetical protein|tara:strand:- start:2075 stop:2761 length:687 start_codon:yes stop_codon:yes gene_type:complete